MWEEAHQLWCANSSLLQAESFQPGNSGNLGKSKWLLCCNTCRYPGEGGRGRAVEIEEGYPELPAALHWAEQPFPIHASQSTLPNPRFPIRASQSPPVWYEHQNESPSGPPHTQPAPAPFQRILSPVPVLQHGCRGVTSHTAASPGTWDPPSHPGTSQTLLDPRSRAQSSPFPRDNVVFPECA